MRCGDCALLLLLLSASSCSVAVLPPPLTLAYGPVVFASSVHDVASPEILEGVFAVISNVHTSQGGRSRATSYMPTTVAPEVLENMQIRGENHFGRGRAQLYQTPYFTIPHGQVWLSLVKTSSEWIRLLEGQTEPPGVALVWQPIGGRLSLRGSFGISKTYANTVRNQLPAWRPSHNRISGVQDFRQFRENVPPQVTTHPPDT